MRTPRMSINYTQDFQRVRKTLRAFLYCNMRVATTKNGIQRHQHSSRTRHPQHLFKHKIKIASCPLRRKDNSKRVSKQLLDMDAVGTTISDFIGPIIICAYAIIWLFLSCCLETVLRWPDRRLRKELAKLSREAEALAEETQSIKTAVNESITTDRAVRSTNLALLSEADEWDTSIRICLTTWKDLVSPEDDSDTDSESWKTQSAEEGRTQHGKYMIGMMRARCRESLARRRELRPQLQAIVSPPARQAARISELQRGVCIDDSDNSFRKEDIALSRPSRAAVVGTFTRQAPSFGRDVPPKTVCNAMRLLVGICGC